MATKKDFVIKNGLVVDGTDSEFMGGIKIGVFNESDGSGYASSSPPSDHNTGTGASDPVLRVSGRSAGRSAIMQLAHFDGNNFFGANTDSTANYTLGQIQFAMNEDSNTVTSVAEIRSTSRQVDVSNSGDGKFKGDLQFLTSDGSTSAASLTTKMTITEGGDVGIGITSPQGNLHVVGDTGDAGRIYLSDADNGTGAGDALLITKSGTNAFVYNRDSGDLRLGSNDNSNYVTIDSSGKVGIANTSPATKLDVDGSITVADDIIHSEDIDNKIAFGTDTQSFQTGGTARFNISDSGLQIGSGARVTTIITQSDGIGSNDNETTLPTSAAVKDYVDNNAGGIASVAADSTPQLGGDLDVNGNKITSASNADITIEPNGTGGIHLNADTIRVGDASTDITFAPNISGTTAKLQFQSDGDLVLRTASGTGNMFINANSFISMQADTIRFGINGGDPVLTTLGASDLTLNTNQGTNTGSIVITNGANSDISITPNGTGQVNLGNFQFDVDQTVGSGQDNYVLTYDHANTQISLEEAASGGIASLAADTTPQLGGDLDVNGNKITSASNADVTIEPNGTGDINLYADTLVVGDSSADFTIQHRTTTNSILRFQAGGNTQLTSDGPIFLNADEAGDGGSDSKIRYNAITNTFGKANTSTVLTTQGTGDMTLSTNSGTNSGTIVIADGADNDISITPNGTGKVIIGSTTSQHDTLSKFTIKGSDAGMLIEKHDDSASGGPTMTLYRYSASEADGDLIGQINFRGEGSTGNPSTYMAIRTEIVDTTEGSKDGQLIFRGLQGNSQTEFMTVGTNGVRNMIGSVVAVSSNTTLTDDQSGSYVYWTGGTLTLPATAIKGQQYTVINNTNGSATPSLGTSNSIATNWTSHAAMADETARTYVAVAANTWIYVG